jgi:CubicO group peptidase (beta-lactamase class C family)
MLNRDNLIDGRARFDRRDVLRRSAAGLAVPASAMLTAMPSGAMGIRPLGDSRSPMGAGRQVTSSTSGGFSADRLERMRETLVRHIEPGRLPGLVMAFSRGGETIVEAIGATAFEGDDPMRRDTIFRIASVTKPITAVAAMILVEEGVIRLDDPVDEWLPELANRQVLRTIDGSLDDTVPANRPLTLRDLLTFRCGYGAIFAPPEQSPLARARIDAGVAAGPILPSLSPDDWLAVYRDLPLAHQPGERWLYNTGSDLAGMLIARATGMSLGDVFQERIFAPLGMKDTGFSVPAHAGDRLAASYWTNVETGEFGVFDPMAGSRFASPPVFESGAGGLVSTADDLLTFGQMMLNDGTFGHGDERLISRASIALMTTDQITAEQKVASRADVFPDFWESNGWGFGVGIVTRRDNLWATPGRYGWDGGYGTSWAVDPVEGLIGVLLTQRVWDEPGYPSVNVDFWNGLYQAL